MSSQPPNLAVESDFSEIAGIYAELGQLHPFQFNWTLTSALEELPLGKTMIKRDAVGVTSFLTIRHYEDRVEIMAIGTSPRTQRSGEARRLLKELKSWAEKESKPIWLEVHENNQAAIALYQSEDFKVVGSRKAYYKDQARALVMMWTFLNIQS